MKPKQPTLHDAYLAEPTPEGLKAVVDEHRDFIDGTVTRMVGKVSPVVKTRSYLLAAEAIKKYDPSKKVPLRNWIAQGLQPIHRISKSATEIIGVPELLRREAAQLAKAREELRERLYRDPSQDELADHTGIPVRKQNRIAKGMFWTKSEGQFQQSLEAGGDDADDAAPAAFAKDDLAEIQDYVYHDLDDIDKQIFQYRLGYNGAEKLPNMEIARRLNLSAPAVTQRANRIQRRLEEAYSWR
jgi:DNA-directed RNA polymerase specialized sigma subunit